MRASFCKKRTSALHYLWISMAGEIINPWPYLHDIVWIANSVFWSVIPTARDLRGNIENTPLVVTTAEELAVIQSEAVRYI
jgi:hypothetical protein